MTYLALNGYQLFNVLLDTVTPEGRTLKHLFRLPSRGDAEVLARRIIDNEPLTLAALGLPQGEYKLIAHISPSANGPQS